MGAGDVEARRAPNGADDDRDIALVASSLVPRIGSFVDAGALDGRHAGRPFVLAVECPTRPTVANACCTSAVAAWACSSDTGHDAGLGLAWNPGRQSSSSTSSSLRVPPRASASASASASGFGTVGLLTYPSLHGTGLI